MKIDNSDGNTAIFPDRFIFIKDKEDYSFENTMTLELVEVLFEREILEKTFSVDKPVGHILEDKVFKVFVKERHGQVYVTESFETNLLEGFN